jgi:hypothetical protein
MAVNRPGAYSIIIPHPAIAKSGGDDRIHILRHDIIGRLFQRRAVIADNFLKKV